MDRWLDVEAAPYDKPVEVRTCGKKVFKARLLQDVSMTEDEKPCDQWQAEVEGKHPRCWSGGACWDSNEDGDMSDPVIGWRHIRDSDNAE